MAERRLQPSWDEQVSLALPIVRVFLDQRPRSTGIPSNPPHSLNDPSYIETS